ncbi:MAG: GNAT family N-acetyltransferase [Rickettsiales bacterium]|nr:GNAT family N-acetyltransferase [Rickettsiales bacterium]
MKKIRLFKGFNKKNDLLVQEINDAHKNLPSWVIIYAFARKNERKGSISGFFESRQVMKINFLGVDEKFQGQGIGGALLNACVDYAINRNVSEIHVETARTWQAVCFYKKHGFEHVGRKNLLIKRIGAKTAEK